MTPIVIELQADSLNQEKPVTELLRKAFVVARKLRISEFEEWISKELNGYTEINEIPDYRDIEGVAKAWNPHNGWQPIYFTTPEMAEIASTRKIGQRVAEIESLLNSRKENGSAFEVPFNAETQATLCKAIGYQTQITLFADQTVLVRVTDAVRNIILNWALKLEEDGVLGEEMKFSEDEKEKVYEKTYNVNNFYAEVTGSQIQQGSTSSSQSQDIQILSKNEISTFISSLKEALTEIEFAEVEEKHELEADISTIEIQLASPKPKEGILREGLGSIKRILEGATGGAVGQLLINLGSLF